MDFFQVVDPHTLSSAPAVIVLVEIVLSVALCVTACLAFTYVPALLYDRTSKTAGSGARSRRVARAPIAPSTAKKSTAADKIPEVKVTEAPREKTEESKPVKVETSAPPKTETEEIPRKPEVPKPALPDTAKSTTEVAEETTKKEKKPSSSKKEAAAPILDNIAHDFFDDETLLDEAMEYILVKKPYKESKASGKLAAAPPATAEAPKPTTTAEIPTKTKSLYDTAKVENTAASTSAAQLTDSKTTTGTETRKKKEDVFSNKELAKKMMNGIAGNSVSGASGKGKESKNDFANPGSVSKSNSTSTTASATTVVKPKTLSSGPNMDDKDLDGYLDNIYSEHNILEEALLDATVESVKRQTTA